MADELGVVAGLVNHYFPVAEDLVTAGFSYAAARERDDTFAQITPTATPLIQMREMLAILMNANADEISLLWLDAWQATRRHPGLRAEVTVQMEQWEGAVGALVARGVAAGQFTTDHPQRAGQRIMALLDALSIQAAIRSVLRYDAIRDMVLETIERELGLARGALTPPA